MPLVTVDRVSKSFGATQALRLVSFTVNEGETLLFSGGNGAGKSTLLRCLARVMRPESGTLVYHRKQHFGVLLQESFVYGHLTAEENLKLYGALYRIPAAEDRIRTLLSDFGLTRHSRKKVSEYSQGMMKRVALARTILHQPEILIFDEPFAHLDLNGCEMVLSVIAAHIARGGTLFLAAHDIDISKQFPCRHFTLEQGAVTREERRQPVMR